MTGNILLLVGGTDPSGGAGLPADIKTAAAMGMHGCPVVSAVTVQDSGRVTSWTSMEPSLLTAQLRSVLDDGPVHGIKSGMIGSAGTGVALAAFIEKELRSIPYVLDPVTVSGGGNPLLEHDALEVITGRLLPLCALVTPNIDEARLLSGMERINSIDSMAAAGRAILDLGAGAVLVKGGHLEGEPSDVLVTAKGIRVYHGVRVTSENVHGTGCSLASACASLLIAGFPLEEAVPVARNFVSRIISRRVQRLHGNLPGHFPLAAPLPSVPDGGSFYLPPAYCAMCGGSMTRTPGEEGHLHCCRCGLIHYRNPLPAVALLVRDGDRVLLVRRSVAPAKGMLCLPGGFMELGETPGECGRRELLEETGLIAGEVRLLDLETDSTAYGGILLVTLEVLRWSGDPEPGDDASELVWCSLADIPGLAFRAHE
ncbi:MAG: bifunctional hydroxymethylpyrimidine kinase/phosphomethylpyrimidine kinase, partial [Candidatus Fermentibacteraceae bacterium]|nr:bifunctional hydroxymethylpyrimidine kinase/phosphomethylpyrimidine kinase [Candidatus Fermentibacteraceae bacterium]